ncbi:dTDP-4-dehydrorhamnose 3,5-epimerase family protein [Candidatus Woesebacteria bacterium]|nr:dTDP-4-dehydrorhamnose 3,5-epimerase family protein [Candidatus Woesebacteria bacterium]
MATELFEPTEANHLTDGMYQTNLEGLLFSASQKHIDHRGYYAELVRLPELEEVLHKPFVPLQINHSHSHKNVIRGFHAENWNKLVTIVHGYCYCVLVDVRPTSRTFGQSVAIKLGNHEDALYGSLFIPAGVANSALALSEPVEYLYFVDQLYEKRDPSGDVSISLFDSDIAAEWPIAQSAMVVSERDRQAVSLRQRFPDKYTK